MESEKFETIVFGGGCFWCVESCFDLLKGIEKVISGYSGGHVPNPTYEAVCTGETGHAEVVKLIYDPKIISFEQLMEVFFFLHDPTQLNRQGNDIGTQYRSIVFYDSPEQKERIEKAMEVSKAGGKWQGEYVTKVEPLKEFYTAETYHQGYYWENPGTPYCSTVVGPKIAKFNAYFGQKEMLKETV